MCKINTMRIVAESIPHNTQRYPTTGDWWFDDAGLQVRVSLMPDSRYELLVGIHEMIEAVLCQHAGIAEEKVSAFDKLYEDWREAINEHPPGTHTNQELRQQFECNCTPTNESEPGDDSHAPYYKQHQIATGIERILAAELGVDWNAYEEANLALYGDEEPTVSPPDTMSVPEYARAVRFTQGVVYRSVEYGYLPYERTPKGRIYIHLTHEVQAFIESRKSVTEENGHWYDHPDLRTRATALDA